MLLGELPVGDVPVELEGPHHLAASPDGKYIYYNLSNYVPGTGSGPHGSHGTGTVPGSLVKLDAATGEKVGRGAGRSQPRRRDPLDGRQARLRDALRSPAPAGAAAEGRPAGDGYSDVAIVDTDDA